MNTFIKIGKILWWVIVRFPMRMLFHLLIDPRYQERIAYGAFGIEGYPLAKKWWRVPIFGGGLLATDDKNRIGAEGDGGGIITSQGDSTLFAGGGGGGFSFGKAIGTGNLRLSPFIFIGGGGGGSSLIHSEAIANNTIRREDVIDASGGGGVTSGGGVRLEYRIGKRYGILLGVQIGIRGTVIGGITVPRPFIMLMVGAGKFAPTSY